MADFAKRCTNKSSVKSTKDSFVNIPVTEAERKVDVGSRQQNQSLVNDDNLGMGNTGPQYKRHFF